MSICIYPFPLIKVKLRVKVIHQSETEPLNLKAMSWVEGLELKNN